MIITPIKTRKFIPPLDNLDDLLLGVQPLMVENSIVVITSKVVSIAEGRCVPVADSDKDELVKEEADLYLERDQTPGGWALHTIKQGILIPTSGIDESNGDGFYILWPKDPMKSAQRIYDHLHQITGITEFGVIITDSRSVPLRRGVVGICLGYYGFEPLDDYRGRKDLFDHELVMSQANIPDSLSAAAVVTMGEGNEQTPIALIQDLPAGVRFNRETSAHDKKFTSFSVSIDEDLFAPFFSHVAWKKGG